jgi:SAM-dependent methyltransferase
MPDKPYAPSCDKNREPILAVLRERLAERTSLLEIGSGTGQHAVYFAPALPQLSWQTSDRTENLPGIRAWLAEAGLPNTPAPIELDVTGPWPARRFDAVFTANTLHIMPWSAVKALFAALPGVMLEQAIFVAYGPFNYGGRFTSESNARFDASLKAGAPHQGIRDFADLDALARRAGMVLAEDVAMPSNNRCLVWRRVA